MGIAYTGQLSTTTSGKTCQRWDSVTPHAHSVIVQDLPDVKIVDAANYCRNPNSTAGGPWCFTIDPGTEWEHCDVQPCAGGECSGFFLTIYFQSGLVQTDTDYNDNGDPHLNMPRLCAKILTV